MLQNTGHGVCFKPRPAAVTACCFVLKGPGITAELPRVLRSLFMHHQRQHGSSQEVPRLVTDCKPHISRSFPGKETFPVDFEQGRREEDGRDTAVIPGKDANPNHDPSQPRRRTRAALGSSPDPAGPNSPGVLSLIHLHFCRSDLPQPGPSAFMLKWQTQHTISARWGNAGF